MKKTFLITILIFSSLLIFHQDISADETIQITYGGELVAGGLGVKRVISGTGQLDGGGGGFTAGYVSLNTSGGAPAPQIGIAYIGLSGSETMDTTKCMFFHEYDCITDGKEGFCGLES